MTAPVLGTQPPVIFNKRLSLGAMETQLLTPMRLLLFGVSYEPELHPAATYRIKTIKATIQVFSTGSLTVTGTVHARTSAGNEKLRTQKVTSHR